MTNPLPSQFDETFNYDPVGNRLRKTGQTTDSTFDSANRLIDDTQFTYMYDNNGNLIKKTNKTTGEVTNYSYDAENHLTQVSKPGTTATYRYDGLGRRIEKNVNNVATRYIYDNEDILLEYNGTTLTARYTHGAGFDEPLVMQRLGTGGGTYFYNTDGLGSIANLTDSAGSVVNSYVYNSFGQVVSQSGTLINPYTYTGREYDSESGLYYYRARYYDAGIGRFLQEDPIGFAGGDINLYVYVFNNPVNFTDPLGLFCLCRYSACGAIPGLPYVVCFIEETCYNEVCQNPVVKRTTVQFFIAFDRPFSMFGIAIPCNVFPGPNVRPFFPNGPSPTTPRRPGRPLPPPPFS